MCGLVVSGKKKEDYNLFLCGKGGRVALELWGAFRGVVFFAGKEYIPLTPARAETQGQLLRQSST